MSNTIESLKSQKLYAGKERRTAWDLIVDRMKISPYVYISKIMFQLPRVCLVGPDVNPFFVCWKQFFINQTKMKTDLILNFR